MSELTKGTNIKDRYILIEYKGSGSFGEVWLAHDDVLDIDVAIKIYISLDVRGIDEFKREYRTTQGISHPNLLTTTYFDVWQQRPFLIMRYCAKGSSSRLAGNTNEYVIWQFIHDVAAGLKFLHNLPEPVIHQDIKPDNILVDDNDRFVITDFGISKKLRYTMRKQSRRDVGAGAISYMGPERFDTDPTPVKASDIWALGASIYELATGELPFSGLGGGMQKAGAEMPSLDVQWSKELNMVMRSCLEKETWDRPNAGQLEDYANDILEGRPAVTTWEVRGQDDSNSKTGEPGHEHSRLLRYILVLIIILALAGGAFSLVNHLWGGGDGNESTIDTIVVEVVDEDLDSAEVEPQEVKKETKKETPNVTTGREPTKPKNTDKKEESVVDRDRQLRDALLRSDYSQVRQLADSGYVAAYGPLATYYLKNNEYEKAEFYAKKAEAAGYDEGTEVIQTLHDLGYYD